MHVAMVLAMPVKLAPHVHTIVLEPQIVPHLNVAMACVMPAKPHRIVLAIVLESRVLNRFESWDGA